LTSYQALIGKVDAVSIAAPTLLHYDIAKDFLSNNTHVLVEKPITSTVEQAEELVKIAKANNLVFQVGHLERFNVALLGAVEQLDNPMFIESHRLSPFNPRGADVNVVLDLMIHDIDIILTLVNSEVKSINASGLPVLCDTVDIANCRIEFENGCVANVTASRVSAKSERKMRFFQNKSCLTVDFQDKTVKTYQQDTVDKDSLKIISSEQAFENNDAILEETIAFVDSILNNKKAVVSGSDGLRALKIATEVSAQFK
jgi:predicted dehydrogenase